ncbi:MAG: hypothetical protein V7L31_01305 [Nostoc sp.]|uniref:hypothetical protein n=1 Tax=Nostoc sp. TaxID=1180 RepID=UPI002FF00A86
MVLIPQITVAQTVEELEQKATSAEEVKNYEEAAHLWWIDPENADAKDALKNLIAN